MTTKAAHLAIDLGAESGRAIIGVLDNSQLSLHEVHRFTHEAYRLPSGLHWNITGMWSEILAGLASASRWATSNSVKLASIGVDTWGVDFGLVTASGELLGLPHAYRDDQNLQAFERILDTVGATRLYQSTGIHSMAINSISQLVARLTTSPALVSQAHRILFMPDLFHYFLSGTMANESSIVSTSQMAAPGASDWAHDLLNACSIPRTILGKIVHPGTRLGVVTPAVVAATGCPNDLQVVLPGSHDTASAVAAVPATGSSSWAYLSSGTWSLLGAELEHPVVTAESRAASFTNETGVNRRIRFLKNIAGLWLVQECRRELERQGSRATYAELTEQAAKAPAFRTVIDIDDPSFVQPGGMPDKIAAFATSTGQPPPSTPGELIRCCLEGLAIKYRVTLHQLESVLNKRFDVLHVVGGGAKNDLLNQMTVDVVNRPVIIGPYEATAVGNLLTQAMGLGAIRDLDHLRRVVAGSFEPRTITPTTTRAASDWDAAHDRLRNVLHTRSRNA